MKKCATCKVLKAKAEFYSYADGRLFGSCKKCYSGKCKQYRVINAKAVNRRHMVRRLRIRYGISVEVYEDLLEYQKGVCAICGSPGKRKMLGVDHDHVTGRIRGLLCDSCNVLIGHSKDSQNILRKAADYLGSTVVPTKKVWVGDNDHEPDKSGWQEVPIIK